MSGPGNILRRVEKELRKPHMKNQYAAGSTSGPSFTIYYCAIERQKFRLVWSRSTISSNGPERSLSLYGACMSFTHSRAIFRSRKGWCLLGLKGDIHAVGSAHILTKDDIVKYQEQLLAILMQMDENEGEDIVFDDDRIIDDMTAVMFTFRPMTCYRRKKYLTALQHHIVDLILYKS